jgi:hypothetical protein
MAARETRGKDASERSYYIRSGASERKFQQIAKSNSAKHSNQHQPRHRRLASQEQIADDHQCYDDEYNYASQTCYVARRFRQPRWPDRDRGISGVAQSEHYFAVESQSLSFDHLLRDEAKGKDKTGDYQNERHYFASADDRLF